MCDGGFFFLFFFFFIVLFCFVFVFLLAGGGVEVGNKTVFILTHTQFVCTYSAVFLVFLMKEKHILP